MEAATSANSVLPQFTVTAHPPVAVCAPGACVLRVAISTITIDRRAAVHVPSVLPSDVSQQMPGFLAKEMFDVA